MTALTGRRRRRTLAMLVCTLLVLAAVPVLGYVGVRAILDATGGKDVAADNVPELTFPSTPTALYLTTNGAGRLTSATVFVLAPAAEGETKGSIGVGGSIVSIPVNADIGFADDQRRSLQGAYEIAGLDGTAACVESLLSIEINQSAVADPAQTAAFFSSYAPLPVTFATPVTLGGTEGVADSTGDTSTGDTSTDITTLDTATLDTATLDTTGLEVAGGCPAVDPTAEAADPGPDTSGPAGEVIAAGAAQLSAEQVAAVLTAGGPSATEDLRRANIEAIWTAFAQAIGTGRTMSTNIPGVAPSTFDEYVARLEAGPAASRGLSTLALAAAQNPSGIDAVQLDRSEAVMVFASIAPGSMSQVNQGLVFRIEAPAGYEAAVKQIIGVILLSQGNVVSVQLNAAPVPETVMYVYDERNKSDAEQQNAVIGPFTFGEPDARIAGIDVILRMGTTNLDRLMEEAS